MNHEALAVVLLAAGCSQRFGPANKLLAPLEDKPMVAWAVQAYDACAWPYRIAVLGYQAEHVAPWLPQWRLVHNPNHEAGHLHSLRMGLQALGDWQGAVMVALADMPLVQPADVQALCHAWRRRPSHILAAMLSHQGRQGHPRILDQVLWRLLLDEPFLDLRDWFARHASSVLSLEQSVGVISDVDTPGDYMAIQQAMAGA